MHKMKWRYTYVSTCLSCIYYGHSSSQQNHILIDQYILLDHRDQLKLTNCPNRKKIPQHIYSHVSNKRWHRLFIIGNCSTQIPLIIVQKNSPFIKFEKKIAARLLFKPHRLLNFKIFQDFLTQNSPFIEFLVCIGLLVTTYLLWYTLLRFPN